MKKISYNDLGCGKEIIERYDNGHLCGVADGWGKEYFCPECKMIEKTLWDKDSERHRKEREEREQTKKYLKSKGGNK